MMYKGKEISPEHLELAKACTTVEELIEKAKEGGIELDKTDAEEFLKMKDQLK